MKVNARDVLLVAGGFALGLGAAAVGRTAGGPGGPRVRWVDGTSLKDGANGTTTVIRPLLIRDGDAKQVLGAPSTETPDQIALHLRVDGRPVFLSAEVERWKQAPPPSTD